MNILEFQLSGQTAFFKMPLFNTYRYLTFSCIHKIALLGVLGAIVGLKGYAVQEKEAEFPEYYAKLKDLKIAIEIVDPLNIRKKEQTYNNSVGYAYTKKKSKGNLVVNEQWLEKPHYIIRIIEDSIPDDIPLKSFLLESRAVYVPYLGKNDHFANIDKIVIKKANRVNDIEHFNASIMGLCPNLFNIAAKSRFYKFSEDLPIGLDKDTNHYITQNFVQSNGVFSKKSAVDYSDIILGEIEDNYYCFF